MYVHDSNAQSGRVQIYLPSIKKPFSHLLDRYRGILYSSKSYNLDTKMLFNRLLTALGLLAVSVQAAPTPQADASAASDYWVASIKRQGVAAFGNADYQIFRNVKDFGAKGEFTPRSLGQAYTDSYR